MAKIKIKTSYDIVDEESAKEGDFSETGWEDEEGRTFDSVSDAVRFLKDEGVVEPSSSCPGKRVWYSTEASQDYRTGEYKTLHYHIHNATNKQEEMIFKKLFPSDYKRCKLSKVK